MSSPESSRFSLFDKKGKDKDKAKSPTGETRSAALPSLETPETSETPETIDRAVVINAALAKVEQIITDAEKHKKTPKGMAMLKKASALVNLAEKAKDDPSALRDLNEYIFHSSSDTLSAATPEGKEVTVDLKAILSESVSFYEKYGINEFSESLKTIDPTLSEEAKETLKEMIEKRGFDRFLILPPENLQHTEEIIQKLKTNLADHELAGLSKDDQYAESYITDSCKSPVFPDTPYGQEAKEKRAKAYLFGYSSGPVQQETKNLKYPEAEKYLEEKNLNGFTLSEYYLTQRKEAEQNCNHSFDAYNGEDLKKSNWTWLIDSRAPDGCVRAGWSPGSRQVRVGWRDADVRSPRLGARPAVVVPIEL